MSKDLNLCQFIGRLGQDPEIRSLQDGTAVASLSLACGWKTKTNEGTEWVRVSAFGRLAEVMGEYLRKGSQVYISGRMQTRKYEKDGVTHYMTEIVANEMQMLGGKRDGDAPAATRPAAKPEPVPSAPAGFDDSDIPF